MSVDYSCADRVVELTFGKFERAGVSLDFPKPGTLSQHLNKLLEGVDSGAITLSHQHSKMLASASVEMWHRAIHSFLWSVALTKSSPLWASVSGYYSSHFVMRAFAHSMGIFKSFTKKEVIQVAIQSGQFICLPLSWSKNAKGEHAFYWKAIKGHPKLISNDLFHDNSERDPSSDAAHRTFANYTDHLCSFTPIEFPTLEAVADCVERISRIRLHSVTHPSREDYPDLQNVQILAFQRILAFQDFLDDKVPNSKFWRAHRRPSWCKGVMIFQAEDNGIEQPVMQ